MRWLIFCVNFTELQGTCPDVWSNIVLGVSGRVFLDEINLSKCDNVTYQPGAIPGVANVINNKRCHMLMLVCPFSKFFCHWNVSDGEIGQAKWIFWLLEVIFCCCSWCPQAKDGPGNTRKMEKLPAVSWGNSLMASQRWVQMQQECRTLLGLLGGRETLFLKPNEK